MTDALPTPAAPVRRPGCGLYLLLITILLLSAAYWAYGEFRDWRAGPDPETVAAASLVGLREQNVLVPFTARYVAVVTASQTRLGLAAQKTLIMPGTVRYELDLAALGRDDISWDAATRTLTVTLPPLRLAGPEIELGAIREYRDGELLIWLTGSEERLDAANETAARAELLAQARGATPMRLARRAAENAVSQNFLAPLRAAGIEARVTARFAE
jgi:hypothetical protein